MPALSVLIPTYERHVQLLRALDSVLRQDVERSSFEVIVVDDGSTDGTDEAVIARFGDQVRLLRQPNRGPSAARNAGARVANGDILTFLDSDTEWYSNHLRTIVELYKYHPAAVMVGTQRGHRLGTETPADSQSRDLAIELVLEQEGVGCTSSVAVRRDVFLAAGGFDERIWYGEDTELFMRVGLLGEVALISATTLEADASPDSLKEHGQRTGGYAPLALRSAENVLSLLDQLDVPHDDVRRTAAEAKRSMAFAVQALERGEDPNVARSHLQDAIRSGPSIAARPRWLIMLLTQLACWPVAERRLTLLKAAATAWPHQDTTAAGHLRLQVARELVRQRRLAELARYAPQLFGVAELRAAAEQLRAHS